MDIQPHAAPQHDTTGLNNTAATTAESAASGAASAAHTALVDDIAFTLTVGEARALFAERGRKVPAERTLQGYCNEAIIVSKKIRTTFGSEWLINEPSLINYIELQPVMTTVRSAPHAALKDQTSLNATAATTAGSGASAAQVAHDTEPIGERRHLADVLIENARLLAKLEGSDELVKEMRDDKKFLKDELAKRDDKAIKDIATKMLDTLQAIATKTMPLLDAAPPAPLHVQVTERQ